jgi:hypothetical protein
MQGESRINRRRNQNPNLRTIDPRRQLPLCHNNQGSLAGHGAAIRCRRSNLGGLGYSRNRHVHVDKLGGAKWKEENSVQKEFTRVAWLGGWHQQRRGGMLEKRQLCRLHRTLFFHLSIHSPVFAICVHRTGLRAFWAFLVVYCDISPLQNPTHLNCAPTNLRAPFPPDPALNAHIHALA